MKDTVGIGIIGTGFARKVQIPAFLECGNARIVSVASGQLKNAEETAREFNIGHFTDDWRETVKREDVDLVCVTTPPDTHYEMTLRAIELKKHVLCEKPMAMNAEQAREMTEKAREKGVLALIDHELRFQQGRMRAFEMIRAGEIGKIRHAKYVFRAPHRGDANLPWNWWSDIKQGGGALGAIGSHVVDSLQWFSGADVSEVFCQLQTHVKARKDAKTGEMSAVTSDDETNLIFRFAESDLTENATGSASISIVALPDYQHSVELSGTKGSLRVEYKGEVFLAKAGAEDWRQLENVSLGTAIAGVGDTGFSRGFMEFAPEIVSAIREGRTQIENAATFTDGLKIQKVLDSARQSNQSGCSVKII
ncbi:MAG TPA: Gfo/Idh/MocA family oxidoreductase [Pyrinomonadaceae bacterium]|nr:Gfo/Idh/MocA family oxidoreductase [Pyrinomonadaceae bacterium]